MTWVMIGIAGDCIVGALQFTTERNCGAGCVTNYAALSIYTAMPAQAGMANQTVATITTTHTTSSR